MRYPASNEAALAQQLAAERALSEVFTQALAHWLPIAKQDVLRAAAEPPPDPQAADTHSAQWDYLVDAMILYAVGIIAADAFDTAYTVMAGYPLKAAGAIAKLAVHDMPGMPDRISLEREAARTITRYTDIDVSSVTNRIETVPDIRRFVTEHIHDVRPQISDAVHRVYTRSSTVVKDEPATATPAEVKADLRDVFDPLDPQWAAVADNSAITQSTGAHNAALENAARAGDREIELEWVAILDSHTRSTHAEATGQRQPPGQSFTVGGEQLRFPADPKGSIEETAGCRCRLFASFVSPHPDLLASGELEDLDRFSNLPLGTHEIEGFKNWVDACGGLPKFIKRITKHLKEKGMPDSQAIATAVNVVKKMCETGDLNYPGKQSANPASRAEACNAAGEWEKLKACAARKRAEKAASIQRSIEWADQGDAPVSEKVSTMTEYRSFASVLAVTGTPTDDGRMFASDINLAFRDFPLPLLWQKQSAGGHTDAYTVGVIESAGVVGNEIIGKGYLLDTAEANEAALQIEHGVTGPSVDLGDVQWELRNKYGAVVTDEQYMADPDQELFQTVTSAKVLAATLVATPAFGQTSITLGANVERGDAALVAAAAMAAPGVIDLPTYDASMFANPQFSGPTLPHMTPEGRIQGHLAGWNVCHIGIRDKCVIAPHTQTDYAWFHTSPPVKTDAGPVKVGRLTVGGGHAGERMTPAATISHYDNVGTCFALVHVGEDEHGIWFSGVAAPGADPEQIAQGLAAPLSGDWRGVGGNLELVAALSVNTPGFPIIASGAMDDTSAPISLIAAMGPCPADTPATASGTDGMSADQLREFVALVIAETRASERRTAAAKAIIQNELRREALAIMQED